jgi:hypothetical protein
MKIKLPNNIFNLFFYSVQIYKNKFFFSWNVFVPVTFEMIGEALIWNGLVIQHTLFLSILSLIIGLPIYLASLIVILISISSIIKLVFDISKGKEIYDYKQNNKIVFSNINKFIKLNIGLFLIAFFIQFILPMLLITCVFTIISLIIVFIKSSSFLLFINLAFVLIGSIFFSKFCMYLAYWYKVIGLINFSCNMKASEHSIIKNSLILLIKNFFRITVGMSLFGFIFCFILIPTVANQLLFIPQTFLNYLGLNVNLNISNLIISPYLESLQLKNIYNNLFGMFCNTGYTGYQIPFICKNLNLLSEIFFKIDARLIFATWVGRYTYPLSVIFLTLIYLDINQKNEK